MIKKFVLWFIKYYLGSQSDSPCFHQYSGFMFKLFTWASPKYSELSTWLQACNSRDQIAHELLPIHNYILVSKKMLFLEILFLSLLVTRKKF